MSKRKEDNPLAGALGRRPRHNRNLSRDDVSNQARILASHFIHDRLQQDGAENVPDEGEVMPPGTPTGPPIERIREVAATIRTIGDELDGDTQLQNAISRIPQDCPRDSFMRVARTIFQDGINWGRIVALFYFAYKLAARAVDKLSFIKRIIEWVVEFIKDFVAEWIIGRGGWESVVEYLGTPTIQAAGVMLAGFLAVLYFVWWKSR
ncbi:apoptosis regulator BAX [Lingula anatina]|uniref:Apoptosis regulator BAX n=1 Tax=Lingula anatina TaxID=7574 RepID=A0A1S3J102_LINAN|nr:apoptosis regulator BAX [Lingula anatina]|eukprot:XP_013403489.1 apoptosis regulator BAX [Lingula anatina]